ncbi:MAG: hypothetical protein U9O96_07010 [Candidatus Thermoplasmatota archaeon]|nr:hypothetical protein [Candidatus Thermoplasmatota archaeon]
MSQLPPSMRYLVKAIPSSSVTVRVTSTLLTYQPLLPSVPDNECVVTGAVVSIMNGPI